MSKHIRNERKILTCHFNYVIITSKARCAFENIARFAAPIVYVIIKSKVDVSLGENAAKAQILFENKFPGYTDNKILSQRYISSH